AGSDLVSYASSQRAMSRLIYRDGYLRTLCSTSTALEVVRSGRVPEAVGTVLSSDSISVSVCDDAAWVTVASPLKKIVHNRRPSTAPPTPIACRISPGAPVRSRRSLIVAKIASMPLLSVRAPVLVHLLESTKLSQNRQTTRPGDDRRRRPNVASAPKGRHFGPGPLISCGRRAACDRTPSTRSFSRLCDGRFRESSVPKRKEPSTGGLRARRVREPNALSKGRTFAAREGR